MAKIKLQGVRLSFPSLFRKAVFQGEETKYEATLLLDKEKHADSIAEINEAIKKGIADNFKGAKIPADKICFKDGDTIDYDGYAGCYVNAVIELWFQNNGFGKRVNANLLGVQFFKDGEPFGDNAGASADDFDAFGDDDDEFFV